LKTVMPRLVAVFLIVTLVVDRPAGLERASSASS
jgi:hypothetical protein